MPNKQFAFMVLEEHPYGRELLMQLMDAGHFPMAIIEEVSDIAEEEKGKFLERIDSPRGHYFPGEWRFEETTITAPNQIPRLADTYLLPTNLTAEEVKRTFLRVDSVSF